MGRKSLYDRKVKPYLDLISEWLETQTEIQVSEKLGIGITTFRRYKTLYPELREAVEDSRLNLISSLKKSLKQKALGYEYEETKITKIRNPDEDSEEEWIEKIEIYKKHCPKDTVAAHLLLKNLDPEWHNDDMTTIKQKQKQLELQEKKIDLDNW